MTQSNAERQAISQARRLAAYNAIKAAAIASGHMKNERDGAGFDRLMESIESGSLQVRIVEGVPL